MLISRSHDAACGAAALGGGGENNRVRSVVRRKHGRETINIHGTAIVGRWSVR